MLQLYSILALDLARDREREARRDHQIDLANAGNDRGTNAIRHGLASGLAAVSKGSAAAVRRLDDRTADDLTDALVTGR